MVAAKLANAIFPVWVPIQSQPMWFENTFPKTKTNKKKNKKRSITKTAWFDCEFSSLQKKKKKKTNFYFQEFWRESSFILLALPRPKADNDDDVYATMASPSLHRRLHLFITISISSSLLHPGPASPPSSAPRLLLPYSGPHYYPRHHHRRRRHHPSGQVAIKKNIPKFISSVRNFQT